MVSSRPYPLSRLRSWTRQQVAVQESLATYLSYRPFVTDLRTQIARSMSELVRTEVEVGATQLRALSREAAQALLPQLTCLAVVGMAPGEHKLIAECDPTLTQALIERLLGGAGAAQGQRVSPLTSLEAGVLSFAAAQILHHFHSGWFKGTELGLVLDRIGHDPNMVAPLWQASETFVCLQWGVHMGGITGGVRLFLPEGLIHERFGHRPELPEAENIELGAMRRHLRVLGEMPWTAHLIGSRIDLTPKDIANVGAGDIIVLENHALTKTAEGLGGELFVQIGQGRHGGFRARLHHDASEAQHLSLEVLSIEVQEPPMDEQSVAQEPQDNLRETQGLLRDLDAPVVVELGRLRMNTQQVVRLRAGQILRLTRGPNDPVDLVVGGKVFARGEMIDVEGEIGVRLTQVAGAEASS